MRFLNFFDFHVGGRGGDHAGSSAEIDPKISSQNMPKSAKIGQTFKDFKGSFLAIFGSFLAISGHFWLQNDQK